MGASYGMKGRFRMLVAPPGPIMPVAPNISAVSAGMVKPALPGSQPSVNAANAVDFQHQYWP